MEGSSSLAMVGLVQRQHILILHRTSTLDTRHHQALACEIHRFQKRPGRLLLSHRRSFLLAFGDLKEQGRDADGPPLCLLSRRVKVNGKEWKWQRCVRTLTLRFQASADAEIKTVPRHFARANQADRCITLLHCAQRLTP